MARPAHTTQEDVVLRERAHAPVEGAVRAYFLSLGRTVDDATARDATSIVLRGLTPSALSRIVSAGITSSDLIQALIPRPATSGTLPPFNWSAITPAEIARLRLAGLLSDHQHRAALAPRRKQQRRWPGQQFAVRWPVYRQRLEQPGRAARDASPCAPLRGSMAANHPDILRLGPAAIEAFARTRFRQETYQSLRDVGFEARDAFNIARFAERTGQDANRVGQDTANSVRIFGNGNPEQERQWREMLRNYYTNPEDAQAREQLTTALRTQRERGTPEQQEHARRMEEIVRLAEQERLRAEQERLRQEQERQRQEHERAQAEAQRVARERAEREARERAAEEERNLLGAVQPAVVIRAAPDGAPPAATPAPQRAAQAQAAPGGA